MESEPIAKKKAPSFNRKLLFFLILIFLICLSCQIFQSLYKNAMDEIGKGKEKATVEALVTQLSMTMIPTVLPSEIPVILPTETPVILSTEIPTISPTGSPTFPPTSSKEAFYIPGITTGDITGNLKNMKFDCDEMQSTEPDGIFQSCHRKDSSFEIRVEILGKDVVRVDSIDAGIMIKSSSQVKTAIDFLGYMATLPYDDSDPEKARNWVTATLPTLTGQGDIRELIIGKVKYTLYGVPTFYTLLMEVIKG